MMRKLLALFYRLATFALMYAGLLHVIFTTEFPPGFLGNSIPLAFLIGGLGGILGYQVIQLLTLPIKHLIMCISGCQLQILNICFLRWNRNEEGRMAKSARRGSLLAYSYYTPPTADGSSPYTLPVCSRLISFLMLAVLFLTLNWLVPSLYASFVLRVLLIFVIYSTARLLPAVIISLYWLRKDPHSRRAREEVVHMQHLAQQQILLADMPGEWFTPYPADAARSPLVAAAMCNQTARLFNSGRYEEAHAQIQVLTAASSRIGSFNHKRLLLFGALCEMLLDQPVTLAAKALKVNPGRDIYLQLTHTCVLYAPTLLVQGNAYAAQTFRIDLEAHIARLPKEHTHIGLGYLNAIDHKYQEASHE